MKFADLLVQIGQAGFEAANVARKSAQMTLLDALEPHPDRKGEYRFKRIMVRMPGPTLDQDEGALLAVPQWGMLTGGNLDLGKLKATIEADVDLSSVPDSDDDEQVPDSNILRFEVRRDQTKRAATVALELEFNMGAPPEIVEQLRDKLVQEFKEALKEVPITENENKEQDDG